MKRFFITIGMVLAAFIGIVGQDNDSPRISIHVENITFTEFAAILKQHHAIYIYFKPEWVESIRVTADGDSLSVDEVLNEFLIPRGIYYWYRGKGHYFVTGSQPGSIPDPLLPATPAPNVSGTLMSNPKEYFGTHTYEKAIIKATIGDRTEQQADRYSGSGCAVR